MKAAPDHDYWSQNAVRSSQAQPGSGVGHADAGAEFSGFFAASDRLVHRRGVELGLDALEMIQPVKRSGSRNVRRELARPKSPD